jgi:UDP-N-acetylglucosamine acyltransferase
MTGVENNVIPYGSVVGDRARLSGLNVVGLKRRAFSKEDISNLRTAYRMLFAEEGTLAERIEVVANMFGDNVAIMEVITFMKADSPRGLTQPR